MQILKKLNTEFHKTQKFHSLGFYPQRTESRDSDTCIHVFTAARLTVAEEEQPSSYNRSVSNTWPNCTVEYHSALKRSDTLTQVTTGTDLEDIELSEPSPSQKERSCRSTYTRSWGHRVYRSSESSDSETESSISAAGAGGRVEGWCLVETVSAWGGERVLRALLSVASTVNVPNAADWHAPK